MGGLPSFFLTLKLATLNMLAARLRCTSQFCPSAEKMPSPKMGQKLRRHTGPFP